MLCMLSLMTPFSEFSVPISPDVISPKRIPEFVNDVKGDIDTIKVRNESWYFQYLGKALEILENTWIRLEFMRQWKARGNIS